MVSCAIKQAFCEDGHLFGLKIIDVDTETEEFGIHHYDYIN